jgi:glutamate---cysteine ligase / carboxylate-amine ligase
MESPDQAIHVANALRTRLPELLALSANSPFWHGRDAGLASTRSKVFDVFPRSGLPPAFGSWEEYELLVERGIRTNSFRDYTYVWWDLRPHPRLGTIEIRICDAQTRLETVGALVALVQSPAATLADRHATQGDADRREQVARRPLRTRRRPRRPRARHRAARARRGRGARRARRPAARHLGCADELALVRRVLDEGTGADEQRAACAEAGSLLAVAQQLAIRTSAWL